MTFRANSFLLKTNLSPVASLRLCGRYDLKMGISSIAHSPVSIVHHPLSGFYHMPCNYILVMQRFLVVYVEYPTIKSLVFSRYTHEPLGENTKNYMGGAVASWLARSTPERALRVRALAGDIVLCS